MSGKNKFSAVIVLLIPVLLCGAVFLGGQRSIGLARTSEDNHSYLPLIIKPESTPTPSPTPTNPPVPTNTPVPTPDPGDGWLGYINFLRGLSGLPSVTENGTWSNGAWWHSCYMVQNDYVGHDEVPGNPCYTDQGDEAAGNSNVMVSSSPSSTDQYAIDLWMEGPFHGVAIMDPQLEVVGFGSYREAVGTWQMGATLDVARGKTSAEPPSGTYPVMWPGDGQSTTILGYRGTEWPDPLASCPGISADYWNPSGPPIYVQIGSGNLTPNVTATSFRRGSTQLEHCVFDETSYSNPSSSTQSTGRWILNTRDAIVIMPKEPLEAGRTYTASITANGNTYTWSFTAESSFQVQFEQPVSMMKAPDQRILDD